MEGEFRQPVLCRSCEALAWASRSLVAPCSSDCGEQSSTSVVFAQAVYANHFVTRSFTVFQDDCALLDIQSVGKKTTKRGVSFSFHSWRTQLDLDRVSALTNYGIALRIWNDVESYNNHRLTCSGGL